MSDFDKDQSTIQYIAQFGVMVGTAVATFLGIRLSRKSVDETPSARDRVIEDLILETKLRQAFGDDMSRTRSTFYSEINDLKEKIGAIETSCAVMRSELDTLKGKRQPR